MWREDDAVKAEEWFGTHSNSALTQRATHRSARLRMGLFSFRTRSARCPSGLHLVWTRTGWCQPNAVYLWGRSLSTVWPPQGCTTTGGLLATCAGPVDAQNAACCRRNASNWSLSISAGCESQWFLIYFYLFLRPKRLINCNTRKCSDVWLHADWIWTSYWPFSIGFESEYRWYNDARPLVAPCRGLWWVRIAVLPNQFFDCNYKIHVRFFSRSERPAILSRRNAFCATAQRMSYF